MYLLPPGPLLCEIRFLLTPRLSVSSYAACFCLCPSLSQLGPLPQKTPAPAFEPCSIALLLSHRGSLRVTAKALPHSIIPHTEILVAPVSCGPKLLQRGLR